MLIGSHNTMSYLPPRKWWGKLIRFTAKCQSANIEDQIKKYGCRLFDIRVRYSDCGDLVFAHGVVEFKGDVITHLQALNHYAEDLKEPVYVRVILESNSPMEDQEWQEEHFSYFCEYIQQHFKNLTFFGGRRKYDWAKIYEFYTVEPELDDKYSSTTEMFGGKHGSLRAKIDDIWPWLYAKTHNKKNRKKGTTKDCLFLDFVNI